MRASTRDSTRANVDTCSRELTTCLGYARLDMLKIVASVGVADGGSYLECLDL